MSHHGEYQDLNEGDDPAFRHGWAAAILAVRQWHAAKAKQAMVQARRDRFPKRYEQEAAHHERSAEGVALLSPEDV
jgi:hypothetical protein